MVTFNKERSYEIKGWDEFGNEFLIEFRHFDIDVCKNDKYLYSIPVEDKDLTEEINKLLDELNIKEVEIFEI